MALTRLFKEQWRVLVFASLVLATFFGARAGYRWLTHSPRFQISDIHIRGNHRITEEQIHKLLQLPSEANIFTTSLAPLYKRVTASPWIRSVEIRRDYPSSLQIDVQEEEVIALVDLGGPYLLNTEAKPFKRATVNELDLGPVITGFTREEYQGDPDAAHKELQYLVALVDSWESDPQRPRIGEIHRSTLRGIRMVTFENAVGIELGRPEPSEFAARFAAYDRARKGLRGTEEQAVRNFRIGKAARKDGSALVTVAFGDSNSSSIP